VHLEERRHIARTSGRSVLAIVIVDMVDADERADHKDLELADAWP